MTARTAVLRALLAGSYYLRGPMVWGALRGRRIGILMYHGVPGAERFEGIANVHGYHVPVREFGQQLDYLRRYCHIVRFSDAVAGRSLSRTRTNVILTFDDGYENTYTNAFRLLERAGVPATFALPTAFVCGRQPLWNDVLEYAVNRSTLQRVRLAFGPEAEREFPLKDVAERVALFDWLMQECTRVQQARREALITAALKALHVSVTAEELFQREDYRPLTGEQIQRMAASGLAEFASHSVGHFVLPQLGAAERRAELSESKRHIEALTGSRCTVFCVPTGRYDPGLLEETFAAGYEWVLTSDPGEADLTTRVLNRTCIARGWSIYRFADVIHGPVREVAAATRWIRSATRAAFRPVGTG